MGGCAGIEKDGISYMKAKRPASGCCAATWDAARRSTLVESAEIMARGAATMDANKISMLEESANGIIS